MNFKFKDWKIITKIVTSFITLIILFLFIIGQSYFVINHINKNEIPLLSANEEVTIAMLETRKNEKDFLMREVSNSDFLRKERAHILMNTKKTIINLIKRKDYRN